MLIKGLFSVLVCISSALLFYPEQLRLSWTEREHEIRVTWVTYTGTASLLNYRPLMCSDAVFNHTVEGTYKVFNEGSRSFPRLQFLHTAIMTGLRSDCYYEYSVGNDLAWSDKHVVSGLTPDYELPYDGLDRPFNLVVIGDLGADINAQPTIDLLNEHALMRNFDAIVHLGDFAYELEDNWGEVGDIFFRNIEPLISNYPYMTLPGNHEEYMNYTHYRERFVMPHNGDNEGTGYFYSLNVGRAHFVMLNTEVYLSADMKDSLQTQLNWLVKDLEKANQEREVRPWLIVMSHHPLYCSVDYRDKKLNSDCWDDANILKTELEDLFFEQSVDVYLQAHVHYYERNSAIYKNETVPCQYEDQRTCINAQAPIYITSGGAGNKKGHNDIISRTPQLWSRSASNRFGYGRLVVHNESHVYWEEYSAESKDILDTYWIVKNITRYCATQAHCLT
jgi:hypothetical protein